MSDIGVRGLHTVRPPRPVRPLDVAARDVAIAIQNRVQTRFAGFSAREQFWRNAAQLARDVFSTDVPLRRHEIVSIARSRGVHARHLAPEDPTCTPRAVTFGTRSAPPPVTLDSSNIGITVIGAVFFTFMTAAFICVFPPAAAALIAFIIVGAFGTIAIVASNGGAQMIAALGGGDINQVFALPSAVLAAQIAGNDYFFGGLANINPFDFAIQLAPQIIADGEMIFASLVSVPWCAFPLGLFCPPPARRGDSWGQNYVDALSCKQDEVCLTVDDCSGRAVACSYGKCRCWGYMPEKYQIQRIALFFTNDNAGCETYGYTTDVLPNLAGGWWYAGWNSFGNGWRGARDILAVSAASNLVSPSAFLVCVFLMLIPGLNRAGWMSVRVVGALLVVQYAAVAFEDVTGWAPLDSHGLTCVVLHSPSIGLWALIMAGLWLAVMAIVSAGVISAGVMLVWWSSLSVLQAFNWTFRMSLPAVHTARHAVIEVS